MAKHRKPPKPYHYHIAVPGQCRYCGGLIHRENGTVNFRASWHKHCVSEYRIIYWPKETRRAIWRRDRGLCSACGTVCVGEDWQVEHTKPLIEANGDIEYWKLSNITTMCTNCHKLKTAGEAKARAAKRRAKKTISD